MGSTAQACRAQAIAEDIPTASSPKLDGMPGGGFQPPRGQRRGSWRTWSGLITASAANALIGSDPSEADELDYSSQTALAASIWNAMNSFSTHIWGLDYSNLLEIRLKKSARLVATRWLDTCWRDHAKGKIKLGAAEESSFRRTQLPLPSEPEIPRKHRCD